MPEVRGVAVPVRAVSNVRVRMAAHGDWPAVAGLLVELGRGVAAGTAADPTHQLQFAGHIRRIENVTLVAEDDDGIVGVIDMEYHQRLGDHRPQARVHDLVVTERARGAGAGRALLSQAEELAVRRGCFRMALVTANWRADAIGFYERQGWQSYGSWFVKQLAGDAGPSDAADREPGRDDN
jgi:GNAT superfamily N-acetyltransferase